MVPMLITRQQTLKIREQTIIGSVLYRNRYSMCDMELSSVVSKKIITCSTAGSC